MTVRALWVCGGVLNHSKISKLFLSLRVPNGKEIPSDKWRKLDICFVVILIESFPLYLSIIFLRDCLLIFDFIPSSNWQTYFKFYCFMKLSGGTNEKWKQIKQPERRKTNILAPKIMSISLMEIRYDTGHQIQSHKNCCFSS